MSTFTVKANMYLRNVYSDNRALVKRSNRDDVSNSTLSSADSEALRKSIRNLADFDFESDEDDVLSTTKANFAYKIRTFIDSYNYTLESSMQSDDASILSTGNKMKSLTKRHESALNNIGISISSKGYLSISNTAVSNLNLSTFGDVCSSDSSYMKELKKYASNIHRKVDYYI